MISRADAIKDAESWVAVDEHERHLQKNVIEWLKEFPTAELGTNLAEVGTDCISRQAAIDALKNDMASLDHIIKGMSANDVRLDAYVSQRNQVNYDIYTINNLPPAQPEPCVDTIDALDESIKHFDDMAEECRRNANIEQNDYMDMRDDAAEYRQLSIWLNELKWLRERFQSQPDLSEYSDKLWKAAYERGKAEALAQLEEAYISGETEAEARFHAQQRWIPCSEQLPEENGQYLITVKYVHVDGYDDIYAEHGEWTDGKWDMFCFGHCGKVENIIAWMPLPEPYAERRTDGCV